MREVSYVAVVLAVALASAYFLALVEARLVPGCPVSIGSYGLAAD